MSVNHVDYLTSSGSTNCSGVLLLLFNICLLGITYTSVNSISILHFQSWRLELRLMWPTLVIAITLRYLILDLHYGGLVKITSLLWIIFLTQSTRVYIPSHMC